jgi:serine/threonine protein kinase
MTPLIAVAYNYHPKFHKQAMETAQALLQFGACRAPTRLGLTASEIVLNRGSYSNESRALELSELMRTVAIPWHILPEKWELPSKDIVDIRPLGEGTFGQVCEVQWKGTPMAFKRIRVIGGGAAVAAALASLLREARNMTMAKHPNVVALYGVSVDNSMRTGLLMELAERGTLRGVLDAAAATAAAEADAASGEPAGAAGAAGARSGMPPAEQLRIAREVTAGITWLHANIPTPIVHRDLKITNVLIMADGTAKISDFGMAAGSGMTTATGTARGGDTRVYAAPEMLQHIFDDDSDSDSDSSSGSGSGSGSGAGAGGSGRCRKRLRQAVAVFKPASDIFALGLVFYAITTGKEPPWEALLKKYPESAALKVAQKVVQKKSRPPLKLGSGAQPFMEEQLRACWDQEPAARPTAAELLQRFEYQHQTDPFPDDPMHVLTRLGTSNFLREYEDLDAKCPKYTDELLKALREVHLLHGACRNRCILLPQPMHCDYLSTGSTPTINSPCHSLLFTFYALRATYAG